MDIKRYCVVLGREWFRGTAAEIVHQMRTTAILLNFRTDEEFMESWANRVSDLTKSALVDATTAESFIESNIKAGILKLEQEN